MTSCHASLRTLCVRPRQPCRFRRHVAGRRKAHRRGRLRAGHHRLDGRPDRGRQAQDLVDRHLDRRQQSRRRHPHGPRRLSRHRRRLRHQDLRSHHRHPGSLCQSARTEGARRRRLAGERQRGARRRRQQAALDAGSDARRIVFLVGDAPPHMDYAQDTKYPTTLAVAKQKDIIVNTVQAGDARDTERVWRDIAQSGNGRFIPIPQDGGQVVVIETPYDDDIIILQNEINRTVIPYGPRAMQKRTEDQTQQLSKVAAAAPAQASDMASYHQQALATVVGSRHRRRRPGQRRRCRPAEARRRQGRRIAGQSARAQARAAHRRGGHPDEDRASAEREARARWWASATHTSPTQRDKASPKALVVRSRGRGYVEGADQAVALVFTSPACVGGRRARRARRVGDLASVAAPRRQPAHPPPQARRGVARCSGRRNSTHPRRLSSGRLRPRGGPTGLPA